MTVPILNNVKNWDCPNCSAIDQTNQAQPHTRMHNCAGMGGLTVPMVMRGRPGRGSGKNGVRVRKVLRDDYVGNEHGLTLDDKGKPVMAVVTEYPDGSNDTAVYSPTALVQMRS